MTEEDSLPGVQTPHASPQPTESAVAHRTGRSVPNGECTGRMIRGGLVIDYVEVIPTDWMTVPG